MKSSFHQGRFQINQAQKEFQSIKMQNEAVSAIRNQNSKSVNLNDDSKVPYKFKAVRYFALYETYKEIKDAEIRQLNESMFPPNFSQTYNKELETYLFQIQVSDMYKKWTIIKRLSQLISLQEGLKIRFPNQSQIFSFPQTKQSQINETYAHSILELFVTFLTSISKSKDIVKEKDFGLFLQNWTSPQNRKIITNFQVKLLKKAGGRHTESSLSRIMNNFISWRPKFFTITKEGVYYTDDEDSFHIKEMILFNQFFSVQHGQVKTGYTFGIVLNSSHRILQIDAQNIFNFLIFIFYIRLIISQKLDLKMNRFDSFAPVRTLSCSSQFYIDGKDYFKEMYQELIKAKSQLFITGWIVSAHLHLIQNFETDQYRVDMVLQKLATQGVKIYIIIYNAPRIAIDINPLFTENYLTSLHPNIKVLKHPNYIFIPFLWSHHEKLVIIDQKVAFMGGLDLGYGRIDDCDHLIADEKEELWKGIDYCNYRIKDLSDVTLHQHSSIDRLTQPRMPWHDVGIKLIGPSVLDLCKHFMQYWNYANHQLYLTQRQLLMFTGIHQQQLISFQDILEPSQNSIIIQTQQTQLKPTFINQHAIYNISQSHLNDKKIETNPVQIMIKDNASKCIAQTYDQLHQFQYTKKDVHKQRKNKKKDPPQNSIFLSFIQKGSSKMYDDFPQLKKLKSSELISFNPHQSKETQKQYYLTYLKNNAQKSGIFNVLPSDEFRIDQRPNLRPIQTLELKEDNRNSESKITNVNEGNKIKQSHQILRSASLWSLGIEEGKHEKSILHAYLSLIQNSKNFIYIQNQFFISVENQIADKLVERIIRAVENKQNFKVLIVVPFLPGFSGQIQQQSSAVMRVQMDLMYKTICRGEKSILGQLGEIGNLEDYLGIYSLRTHGLISGLPATQIVYIHSKLLIVDDCVALVGSANINDRSLMGDRDSQIAVIVEDSDEVQIKNQCLELPTLKVKRFAHQLRKKLYIEHFGLSQGQSGHFLNFSVWDKMQFNAERNQKAYRKIFGCYPDNGIKRFSDVKKFRQQAETHRYDELKLLIKGFACPFQSDFLCQQSLELHSGQKQYYIPFINFT